MSSLVSTITTVKNGERTIKKTINSILNQTYSNIEIIIVDDGSTDNTPDILREYAKKYDNITLFFSGGIGRAAALNKAVELSKGDYVSILDADDLFHPQKIEIQVNKFRKNPDYFLISTKSKIISEDEDVSWILMENPQANIIKIDDKIHIKNPINHSSVMMDKHKLVKINTYNEDLKTQLDYDLWLRAYTKNYNLGIIDLELTAKRIHENQSFENKNRVKYTWNNLKLQMNYLTQNKKYFWYFIPTVSFILAQLPFSVRRKINAAIEKVRLG